MEQKKRSSDTLHTQFWYSVRWNSLESIAYYTLFAAHQLMLRIVTSTPLYGTIGVIFALIYLVITLANFGLDLSIGPFFNLLSVNKKQFRQYLIRQLMIQCIIYGVTAIIIFFIFFFAFLPIKQMSLLALPISFILSFLIITEGIKKSLRVILQLAFFSHITALVELFYIISYIILFWSTYMLRQTVSLYMVFIPMLTLSCISTAFLVIAAYRFYSSLPELSVQEPLVSDVSVPQLSLSWKQIVKNRAINYGYQLTKIVFTSNFLIPFFAFHCGLSMAALLELVTAFNQFITIIIQKIFGITGQALLSQAKNLNLNEKRKVFELVSNRLYSLLCLVILIAFIAYRPLLALNLPYQTEGSSIAVLFFLLLFCENFIILYEKWFIIEEKTFILILLNSFSFLFFYSVPRVFNFSSIGTLLVLLITLRLFSYLLLVFVSSYRWKLTIPLCFNRGGIVYFNILKYKNFPFRQNLWWLILLSFTKIFFNF